MLKIRLRRMGAIRRPHYRIVVADARSPRDGRFIESLGHYNPITDPATIQIDVTKYEEWKSKGAQPTDAVASLVKQFNRAERKAAASGEEAPAPSRRTRTASTKGIQKAPVAQAMEIDGAADTNIEMTGVTGAATEAEATETSGSHMNEAMAEATRDGGEGSDAIIGESAETGTSANSGAATEEAASDEETAPADES